MVEDSVDNLVSGVRQIAPPPCTKLRSKTLYHSLLPSILILHVKKSNIEKVIGMDQKGQKTIKAITN